jgi:thiol-disulfide isomerase/thioredoxin
VSAHLQSPGQPTGNKNGMPPFTILLTNGNSFSYKDLLPEKPVMLIYFAPDCEHCREFIKKLADNMNGFKQIQITLISYLPLPALQKFNKEFKLDQFPNIKIGTEGNSFLVPAYFKIVKFPFTALYNKAGKLMGIFREEPSLKVLTDFSKKR